MRKTEIATKGAARRPKNPSVSQAAPSLEASAINDPAITNQLFPINPCPVNPFPINQGPINQGPINQVPANQVAINPIQMDAGLLNTGSLNNWLAEALRCEKKSAPGEQGANENVGAGQVHDLVQDVVSDLDSLLRFIINLRFGLDGSKPCSHEEIANHLNVNLKACVREKIRNLLGINSCSKISSEDVQALEAKAERALCRRRVEQ